MQHKASGRLAEVCRSEAAVAADGQTRDCLLKLAVAHEAQASPQDLLAHALFREGTAATFREGYVFRSGLELRHARGDGSAWGYWSCDVAGHDRLAWSDKVYALFGLPPGIRVDRDWAVARYGADSQSTLQRVRDYALRHAVGFILDAEIDPVGTRRQWIRIFATPVFENGRIARLHGLKRGL